MRLLSSDLNGTLLKLGGHLVSHMLGSELDRARELVQRQRLHCVALSSSLVVLQAACDESGRGLEPRISTKQRGRGWFRWYLYCERRYK